jgi:hypothetical protein
LARIATVVLSFISALALTLALPGSPAHAASSKPRIADAQAFDAPIGDRGGIMTPIVACRSWRIQPSVRTVIKGVDSDYRSVYRYRGTLPGYGFPRVGVGEYKVITVATCRGHKRTRTELVTVSEKTTDRTVSPREWRKIKRGMKVERVRRIVGYNGTYGGRFQGEVTRTYDMMGFWRWSLVTFRDGRVAFKNWNVDHD